MPRYEIAYVDGGRVFFTDLQGNRTVFRSGVPSQPGWAPDHSGLAYVNASSLYIADKVDGIRAAVSAAGTVYWPEYSADGRWIYFSAHQGCSGCSSEWPSSWRRARSSASASAAGR